MNWFSFKNAADAATIDIFDEIGGYGVSARTFIEQLDAIEAGQINLRLLSPGGSIIDGFAIYNALTRHPAKVSVSVEFAASMASVIAMAGDEVEIAENGWMMIHNPWAAVVGESEDLRRMAEVMDSMRKSIIAAYVRKSGQTADAVAAMMDAETWMDGATAKKKGFADKVKKPVKMAALANLDRFNNLPTALTTATKETDPMDIEQLKADLAAAQELLAEITAENEQLKAAAAEAAAKSEITDAALASAEAQNAQLTANVEAARAELAKANAKVAALCPGLKATGSTSTDTTADFFTIVKDKQAAGMDYDEAVVNARLENPAAFSAMLKKAGTVNVTPTR